jgi:hypothetical protein
MSLFAAAHQSGTMRDRYGEGPEPQLRRSYACQCAWMTPVDKPKDTEPDNKQAGAYLYLALPFDECHQHREGKEKQEHREQMADH